MGRRKSKEAQTPPQLSVEAALKEKGPKAFQIENTGIVLARIFTAGRLSVTLGFPSRTWGLAGMGGHVLMNCPWYYKMDEAGETPMSRACKCGHRKLAELLLRHDRELMEVNDDDRSRSELQRVAYWGLHDSVRGLLEEGVSPSGNAIDGDSPLHEAARNGHTETVRELLTHGADVNERNPQGMTTLHWVAMNGREDLAEMLLEHGAEINCRDSFAGGMTPRGVAMLMGYEHLAELIGARGGSY